MVPTFYWKLSYMKKPLTRFREPLSWRKAFKSKWKTLASTPIPYPINPKYHPHPYLWLCTCPYFVTSRFLICKHLVQACRAPDSRFFHLVPAQSRTLPFWQHSLLIPLLPPLHYPAVPSLDHATPEPSAADNKDVSAACQDAKDDDNGDENWDEAGDEEGAAAYDDRCNAMLADLCLMHDVITHNRQFHDVRLLDGIQN
jgi:hypothetical protein